MAERERLFERLFSFRKGAKPKDQLEDQGKGLAVQFDAIAANYYNYVYGGFTLAQKKARIGAYREMEWYPEVADAIDLIVDAAVQADLEDNIVNITILNKDLKIEKNGKLADRLFTEFKEFLENVYGGELELENNFRRWYVDGELWLEKIKGSEGFEAFKRLPPETMIMELNTKGAITKWIQVLKDMQSFMKSYGLESNTKISQNANVKDFIEFKLEEIVYVDSHIYGNGGPPIDARSRLEIAVRTYKQLRLLEDALVIYRIVRAPEKRVFNIDVGNMPKGQAESYIKRIMDQHRQKKVYDPSTGEINTKYNPIAMNEDYYIPTRGANTSTTIDSLPGAANLGNITDVDYFLKKIYRALKIPRYLVEENATYGFGTNQVNQEDVRFARHIERLQQQWVKHIQILFLEHLSLKKIDAKLDNLTNDDIKLVMTPPSYYKEFKDIEVEEARVRLFQSMNDLNVFSREWLLKNILKMSDVEIKEVKDDLGAEKEWKEFDTYRSEQGLVAAPGAMAASGGPGSTPTVKQQSKTSAQTKTKKEKDK